MFCLFRWVSGDLAINWVLLVFAHCKQHFAKSQRVLWISSSKTKKCKNVFSKLHLFFLLSFLLTQNPMLDQHCLVCHNLFFKDNGGWIYIMGAPHLQRPPVTFKQSSFSGHMHYSAVHIYIYIYMYVCMYPKAHIVPSSIPVSYTLSS